MEVNKVYHGNCLDVLKTFQDNSIDSCVTDPPYGINFMNKHWDYDVPKTEVWKEILRVLKPGGHLLCACGTRTQHRMAVNIEDAGFEIRDVITWHYGSGFPKSLNIGKSVDDLRGNEREVTGSTTSGKILRSNGQNERPYQQGKDRIETPQTKGNSEWEGWGTALKPATEFWTLARKPFKGTVAGNVLEHGTGGINIDGSRIGTEERSYSGGNKLMEDRNWNEAQKNGEREKPEFTVSGRFPANVIFDEEAGKLLDEQTGILTSGTVQPEGFKGEYKASIFGKYANNQIDPDTVYGDSGGASRFFYCPKADDFERNKGLKGLKGLKTNDGRQSEVDNPFQRGETIRKNHHPTVKPIDLMRYLVKLITPKGGIVIDPYCGSGTTCIGAKLELINYIGIERELEYCKIAEARIAAWNPDKYKPQTLF